MRAVLAVVAGAAVVATAGAVHHIRVVNATPPCSAAVATLQSDQDPARVAAYWTKDRIEQAQRNMRNTSDARRSAVGTCRTGP